MNISVRPVVHDYVKKFLSDKKKLYSYVGKYGSPLHILFPRIISDNINQLENYYSNQDLIGRTFFACKANKSLSVLKEVKKNNIGVEVSSLEELNNALKVGFEGKSIISNGPKNEQYLTKAILSGTLVCVDSLSEIELIKSKNIKTDILVRFSNFRDNEINVRSNNSRFGISIHKSNEVLSAVVGHENINVLGFSFHIDSTSDIDKQIALKSLLELTVKWMEKGFNIKVINIGGGYRVNYVEDKREWHSLLERIQKSVMNQDDFTWNHHSFGYYMVNSRIRGEGSFYPYYSLNSGIKQIDNILNISVLSGNTNAKSLIRDLMLELYVETGRFLLNQVGITLFKITEVEEEDNYFKVIVDGNYMNISAEQDIMIDPFLIKNVTSNKKENCECFIFGNLCLENDILFKRKISFDQKPEVGDLLVVANTAAYKMDYSDSSFIHHKAPERVIL